MPLIVIPHYMYLRFDISHRTVCVCVRVCVYVRVCVFVCVCVFTYMHKYESTVERARERIHIYVYICMDIHK